MERASQTAPNEALDRDGFGLTPGRNCWRKGATPLIDAAAYYSLLRDALERAERQVYIVGWDVHARMRLTPQAKGPAAEESLRELLSDIARRRPALEIRILLWDFTLMYAAVRLPFPKAVLDWSTPPNVSLALDNRLPAGASHHQKLVVIDDRLAFIGGLDLTEGRWDTPAHASDDPRRTTARGDAYPPFHDVQLAVSGDIGSGLGELCRTRWTACVGEALGPARAPGDPWPPEVEPLWRDVEIGIARTVPAVDDDEPVQEILQLYVDSIRAASACLYIENQYLTADEICDALAARLREPEGPEIVIVTRAATRGWLEHNTMDVRRQRFLERLRQADVHRRLRVYAPRVPGLPAADYKLHSKVMIVDDSLVRIGSANLNNRSMGLDSECDAVVVCKSPAERLAALEVRDRLLAEHLGVPIGDVEGEVRCRGSVISAIEALRGEQGRGLEAVTTPELATEDVDGVLPALADPERPLSAQDVLERLPPGVDGTPDTGPLRSIVHVALVVAALAGVAIAWHYTGLRDLVDPGVAARLLAGAPSGVPGALLMVVVFVIGGLALFPVTVLILGCGLAFGPWTGLIYAALGTYFSATVMFALGRLLGHKLCRRWMPAAVAVLGSRLARKGMIAVAALRIVPVAPFTVVNLLAGAAGMRFADYALGTIYGMTPGIVVMTAMGGQLGAVIRDPSPIRVLFLAFLALLWAAVGLGLHALVIRTERKRNRSARP
jgi:phospholipase D1/2